MWFNIPTEKETDKEAHRGEKSLMPNRSLEVSLHGFIVENLDIFKDCRHLKRDKGASNDVEPRMISKEKGTSPVATSEEKFLFICEQESANLVSDE